MTSNFPPRRRHERYACRLTVHVKAAGSSKPFKGEFLNISMGGAYLRLRGSVGTSNTLHLEIEFGGERLALRALVIRAAEKDPKNPGTEIYGLAFQTDAKTQDKLRQIIDRIRTQQRGPDLKTPNYWKL